MKNIFNSRTIKIYTMNIIKILMNEFNNRMYEAKVRMGQRTIQEETLRVMHRENR